MTRGRCIDCVSEGITTIRKAPHPGPRCATHHRAIRRNRRNYSHEKHIGETYGITKAEYNAIWQYQGGVCAICVRATGTGRRRLSVDHCHTTGMVRGLLCQPCNKMLGHLRDDPVAFKRSIGYLRQPPAVAVIGTRIVP